MCAWCLPASPPCQQLALVRSHAIMSTGALLRLVKAAVSEQEGAEGPLFVSECVAPSHVRAVSCCCMQKSDVQHGLCNWALVPNFASVIMGCGWLQGCSHTGPEECTALQHASSWLATALMSSAAVTVATAAASARMHVPASHHRIFSSFSCRAALCAAAV